MQGNTQAVLDVEPRPMMLVGRTALVTGSSKGLGKAIMQALMERLAERVPGRAYVSLIADGDASHLYAAYGFEPVAPKSQGMAMWLDPADG